MLDVEVWVGKFPPLRWPLGEVHYIHVHVTIPMPGSGIPHIYCSAVQPVQGTGNEVEEFISELRTRQREVIAAYFREVSERNPLLHTRMIRRIEAAHAEFKEDVVHTELSYRSPDTTCEGCAQAWGLPYEEYLVAADVAKQFGCLLYVP